MLKKDLNFKKENIMVYGGCATGKTSFVNMLILDRCFQEKVYLMNEYNLSHNAEIFKDAVGYLTILLDFSQLQDHLKKMISGEISNSTLVIDSIYPYCDQVEVTNLMKEFMELKVKNGNNLVVTCNKKKDYDSFNFDSYLMCHIDRETMERVVSYEIKNLTEWIKSNKEK